MNGHLKKKKKKKLIKKSEKRDQFLLLEYQYQIKIMVDNVINEKESQPNHFLKNVEV